jgi:DNA polymerase elongation subunit (family B)
MVEFCKGWLLDAYIENDEAVLWIKKEDGAAVKLFDEYEPGFYLESKNKQDGSELIQILSDLHVVSEVKRECKSKGFNESRTELLYVKAPTISHYNLLSKVLQHEMLSERINKRYNNNLTHLQRYLFTKLNIEPCSKVIVEYDGQNLVSIEKIEDNDIKSPFSVMHAEIILQSDSQVLDLEDSIKQIEAKFENEQTLLFEGDESKTLTDFCNYVVSTDPDVIVFSNYDLNILNYLFGRMKVLSLNLKLGRYKIDAYFQNQIRIIDKWTQGRIYITEKQFSEAGIEGIIELSKFSHLPVRQLLRYSIGRLIANRIFFELLQRDFVIPDEFEASHEQIRTLEEIIDKDKAGMIFSPLVGLHQNIAVLDFNDEFSNIIINENISYEPKNKDKSIGILPSIVKQLVDKRIQLKRMINSFSIDSREWTMCKHKAETIKKILVCLYGTTGSYWNRYGNVNAFEEINKKSRQILLQTKDIVQRLGFDLVYSDTDACFVHKVDASRSDYEELKNIISKETGLALSLEYHYKFLVLLPLEADEKLEALKHYFGITYDGELIMRGIETRRHDAPKFIKDFQTELLYTLFDCEKVQEIESRTLEDALLCVTRTIDKVMTGQINIEDLVISKLLRMDITRYRNIFPHVAAAIQSSNQSGKLPTKGKMIHYLYTNSQHQNPLNRVAAVDGFLENIEYDREKYKELLLDATETTLGIFGFDRTLYGKAKDKKWWMELKRNRTQDVLAEVTGS